jgi:membrane-associated protein
VGAVEAVVVRAVEVVRPGDERLAGTDRTGPVVGPGRRYRIGDAFASLGVTLAGYILGSTIPGIDTYLLPIIAVVVVLSLIPIALELHRARREA